MSYLTETERDLQLPALSYDQAHEVISVGDHHFPINAELADISPWIIVKHDDPNQLDGSSVCMNTHAKLIGAPKFHEWLGAVNNDAKRAEQVRKSTVEVIRSVFTSLKPEIDIPEFEDPGPFGFNMAITPDNHGNLYTFGSCACLHPHPEGHWVGAQDWDEGYCEYDWHNTDADTQVWSLLAGMGHLACLAAR